MDEKEKSFPVFLTISQPNLFKVKNPNVIFLSLYSFDKFNKNTRKILNYLKYYTWL